MIVDPANNKYAFRYGRIVTLSTRTQEQLDQTVSPMDEAKKAFVKEYNKIPTRRVRRVKLVKRNGKWVEVK